MSFESRGVWRFWPVRVRFRDPIEQQSTTHLYRITINQTLYEPANAAGSADDHHGRRRPARQGQGRTGVQHLGARAASPNPYVRRSGRKGWTRCFVDSTGGVTITNDGVTILQTMDIDNPTAEMIVEEVAQTQEDEAGDGTTSAVAIAGELLKNAEDLRTGYSPDGRHKGLQPRERVRPRAGRRGRHTGRPRRHRDPEKRRRDVDDRQGRGAR